MLWHRLSSVDMPSCNLFRFRVGYTITIVDLSYLNILIKLNFESLITHQMIWQEPA